MTESSFSMVSHHTSSIPNSSLVSPIQSSLNNKFLLDVPVGFQRNSGNIPYQPKATLLPNGLQTSNSKVNLSKPPKKQQGINQKGGICSIKRHDNSLSILTRRFMRLIKSNPSLTVDLNQASIILGVQKRRIYDITNVLEGIGYVYKISKNKLQWTGPEGQQAVQTQEAKENNGDEQDQIYYQEYEKLNAQEEILDGYLEQFERKIKELRRKYDSLCYLNSNDIFRLKESNPNSKSLLIQIPLDSQISFTQRTQIDNSVIRRISISSTPLMNQQFQSHSQEILVYGISKIASNNPA